jgi:hypothetical protein
VTVQEFMAQVAEKAEKQSRAERRPLPEEVVWKGTATLLLGQLNALVDESVRRDKRWPDSASALGSRLRRIVHGLGKVGIEVIADRSSAGRKIALRQTGVPVQTDLGAGTGGSDGEAPSH